VAETAGIRRLSWADAAQSAGYGFSSRSSGLGLPGLLFRAGEKTQVTGVVDALGAANPFVAGTLTGHYANGTAAPRVLTSSFVAIPLTRHVPNLVLMARGLGLLSLAGLGLEGRQRLPLDNSLERSFTLYGAGDNERDGADLFAPAVVDQLLAATGACDVELVDDWMFVYSLPGRYRSGAALALVEDAAAVVRSTIARDSVTPPPATAASNAMIWLAGGLSALLVALVARWYIVDLLPGL